MAKFFNYTNLLALAALLHCTGIDAKAVRGISYVDDIELSYEDGIWHCDRLICPKDRTFGCKILRANDVNEKEVLVRTNICYAENNSTIAKYTQSEYSNPVKTINMNIDSFIGANSAYTTGYSRSSQNFNGIVAADDWARVQQVARDAMKPVDDFA